jgi:hypothetical protein
MKMPEWLNHAYPVRRVKVMTAITDMSHVNGTTVPDRRNVTATPCIRIAPTVVNQGTRMAQSS